MKSIFSVLLSSICFISSCANENIDGKWIVSKRGKVILNTRPINYSKVTSPDSLIIDAILDEQNESMLLINTKLETNFVSEFTVYLFNSDEAKEKIGTNGGGHVNLTTLTIYYTFLQAKNPKNGKTSLIQPGAKPGDVIFVDRNKDGKIDQLDKTQIGDPNPHLIYGFS